MDGNSINDKISNVTQQIMQKQQTAYIQIGYFFLIICAMSFIISSIFTELVNVIYIYFEKSKLIRGIEKSIRAYDDNYYDEPITANDNELDTIEETIMIQHEKQKKLLKDNLEWKKEHNIPNRKIESKIDLTILEDKYDDYKYHKSKNGMPFWKMLIMPPKYHELVQHNAKPYYRFIDDQ